MMQSSYFQMIPGKSRKAGQSGLNKDQMLLIPVVTLLTRQWLQSWSSHSYTVLVSVLLRAPLEWNGLYCNAWPGWHDYRLCNPFDLLTLESFSHLFISDFVCWQITTFPAALCWWSQSVVCTGWFHLLSCMAKLMSFQNRTFLSSYPPSPASLRAAQSLNVWRVVTSPLNSTCTTLWDLLPNSTRSQYGWWFERASCARVRGHDLCTTSLPASPTSFSFLTSVPEWFALTYGFTLFLYSPQTFLKNRFSSSCQTDTDSLNAHQQKNSS